MFGKCIGEKSYDECYTKYAIIRFTRLGVTRSLLYNNVICMFCFHNSFSVYFVSFWCIRYFLPFAPALLIHQRRRTGNE